MELKSIDFVEVKNKIMFCRVWGEEMEVTCRSVSLGVYKYILGVRIINVCFSIKVWDRFRE